MKVLLIGSGGREHAIAWKLLQSPLLTELYLTSPNATVEVLQQQFTKPVKRINLKEEQHKELIQFTTEHKIDLVVIGNEAPLANGLSDQMCTAGVKVFGPSQAAAQIESSKAFAKDFMQRHGISTARYAKFTEFSAAKKYLSLIDYPVVIKASGLAAGKGVFLPVDIKEAEIILRQLLQDKTLGTAAQEVIIEERLEGEEVSLLAFTDGVTIKPMPPARDHKRLLDGNQGPNTGGMGVYAPVANISPEQIYAWTQNILQPTIDGLRAEGKPFVGVLYAGLMLTIDGPKVLEFNCRFGDPETQVLLPLLENDLLEIMLACAQQELSDFKIHWKKQSCTCVVLASKGYPEKSEIGFEINGLEKNTAETLIFHAGTRCQNGKIITAGGRVLGITALGGDLNAARDKAYLAAKDIDFAGKQYRNDIGK